MRGNTGAPCVAWLRGAGLSPLGRQPRSGRHRSRRAEGGEGPAPAPGKPQTRSSAHAGGVAFTFRPPARPRGSRGGARPSPARGRCSRLLWAAGSSPDRPTPPPSPCRSRCLCPGDRCSPPSSPPAGLPARSAAPASLPAAGPAHSPWRLRLQATLRVDPAGDPGEPPCRTCSPAAGAATSPCGAALAPEPPPGEAGGRLRARGASGGSPSARAVKTGSGKLLGDFELRKRWQRTGPRVRRGCGKWRCLHFQPCRPN